MKYSTKLWFFWSYEKKKKNRKPSEFQQNVKEKEMFFNYFFKKREKKIRFKFSKRGSFNIWA